MHVIRASDTGKTPNEIIPGLQPAYMPRALWINDYASSESVGTAMARPEQQWFDKVHMCLLSICFL
jgi:hypothetical protein